MASIAPSLEHGRLRQHTQQAGPGFVANRRRTVVISLQSNVNGLLVKLVCLDDPCITRLLGINKFRWATYHCLRTIHSSFVERLFNGAQNKTHSWSITFL